jgi:hypothetical protein
MTTLASRCYDLADLGAAWSKPSFPSVTGGGAGAMALRSPNRRNEMWNNQTWRNQAEEQIFDPPRTKLRMLLPLPRAWLLILALRAEHFFKSGRNKVCQFDATDGLALIKGIQKP